MEFNKNISVIKIIDYFKSWLFFLLKKIKLILISTIICSLLGFAYAYFSSVKYTAELTFALEMDNQSKMSSYASLASQFGIDIGGKSGAFEGDNLLEFLKSALIIQKTLLTPIKYNNDTITLIDLFLNKEKQTPFIFYKHYTGTRSQDSVLNMIYKNILSNCLSVDRKKKNLEIFTLKMTSKNEVFSKLFAEQIINNAKIFYTEYKTSKSQKSVDILQKQADSIKQVLNANITNIGLLSDFNINPLRQTPKGQIQKKNIDLQSNSAIYIEITKNLEISKMGLLRETPFIQIIDYPKYPLEKDKPSRLMSIILGAFFGCFISLFCLSIYKFSLT